MTAILEKLDGNSGKLEELTSPISRYEQITGQQVDLAALKASSATLECMCVDPTKLEPVEASSAILKTLTARNVVYRKGYSPYIDFDTMTWWQYDDELKGFVDTRVPVTAKELYDFKERLDMATGSSINLITYPYYDFDVFEHNGITYRVNKDGSITANGTAEGNSIYCIARDLYVQQGTYYLTGCPDGGSAQTYYMQAFSAVDTGNGAELITDADTGEIYIYILSGTTVNDLTFYPSFSTQDDAFYVNPATANDDEARKLIQIINQELTTKPNIDDLADVAFSGDYNDLRNTPDHLRVDTIDNLETLIFTY